MTLSPGLVTVIIAAIIALSAAGRDDFGVQVDPAAP